jgi:outer membrane protein assembly factor BamD (BamD/ComL family)
METPAPSEPSIAAQLAYLREARARLARGDAAGALAALDRYPTEFPGGALAPEVSAMAVDAALAAGRTGEARARADKFLAEHGTSPQAPRIRRLRERLDNP